MCSDRCKLGWFGPSCQYCKKVLANLRYYTDYIALDCPKLAVQKLPVPFLAKLKLSKDKHDLS